jgi:nicotinate-nucleotide--dimethylbenzimidazole phosphoribosyltransferase
MSAPRLDLPAQVPGFEPAVVEAATRQWATRAKPAGSLGRLEALAVQLCGIAGRSPAPIVERPAIAVFAADHGVVADGASAWPSEITALMVETMAAGRAAINTFASTVGARVIVVDVGVAAADPFRAGVIDARVRPGTASLAREPAMHDDEARRAVAAGYAIAMDLVADGADCLVGGEMGIGNTTAATAVIAGLLGRPAGALVGPGAGLPADALEHKASLIDRGLSRLGGARDPWSVLREVGGLEIGALAGFMIAGAERAVPVLVDGVIAGAGALLADALVPGLRVRLIAGHRSTEPAASAVLDHLDLAPLLDLELRLGEGTGACLAIPLLRAAAAAHCGMAELPER